MESDFGVGAVAEGKLLAFLTTEGKSRVLEVPAGFVGDRNDGSEILTWIMVWREVRARADDPTSVGIVGWYEIVENLGDLGSST